MSDEDTTTGDDQSQTGEDQQSNANDARIEQLESELKETNAAFTRYQQQQAQAQTQETEETEEVDLSGITPEQRKMLQRASGADELKKEIDALKKDREAERQQREADHFKSDVDGVSKEFPTDDGYPKVNLNEIAEHMQKTGIFNPRAAYKDMHEAAIYDVKTKAATKASPSDRSDATQEPGLSRKEYLEKLQDLTLKGQTVEARKLMLEHGSIAPDRI